MRTISNRTALVIPLEDDQLTDWFYLFDSFFDLNESEDDQEDILLPLRLLLCQFERFNRNLHELSIYLTNLHKNIRQLFPNYLHNQLNLSSLPEIKHIRYVYLIQKRIDHIDITHQIPIGCVLEPIQCSFQPINQRSFEQKQNKYEQISICLDKYFNRKSINCFQYKYHPYGSFRLV